jgi:predicted phage-related endonuclease
VLIGGNNFKWKFVERDEEIISMLVQLESEFWQHVQNFTPPPLDGSEASAKFISEKFPRSIRAKINLPDAAAALIDKYESACEMVEHYTGQKQEAENLLKQMLGENEAGTVGEHVVTWKSVIQERLDSKTLKSERPSLFKKYANKIMHRRFSIKAAS